MAKASDFVEMSLLMDDDFGLLLAAEKLKCRSIRSSQVFSFNEYDVNRFRVDFRFHKPDVLRLKDAFSIPDWMGTRNGLRFEGVEGEIRISAFKLRQNQRWYFRILQINV